MNLLNSRPERDAPNRTPGLGLWLDSRQGVVYATQSLPLGPITRCSQWSPAVGGGEFVQATNDYRPEWVSQNDSPDSYFLFDGNDEMEETGAPVGGWGVADTRACDLLALVKRTGNVAGVIFALCDSNWSALRLEQTAGGYKFSLTDSQNINCAVTVSGTTTGWHLLHARRVNGTLKLRLDYNAPAQASLAGGDDFSTLLFNRSCIGSGFGVEYYSGGLSQVAIYNRRLTPGVETRRVRDYFARLARI